MLDPSCRLNLQTIFFAAAAFCAGTHTPPTVHEANFRPLLTTLPPTVSFSAELATVTVEAPSANYVFVNGSSASTLTFNVAPYSNIQINAPMSALVSATPASATVTYYN